MRAATATLLLASLLPPAAAQGETFKDPDFGFLITLPPGLTAVDEAGRAAILGNAEAAKNPSRDQAQGKPIAHNYLWIDSTSPYDRQVAITLIDGLPPWKPEEFADGMSRQGLNVESHEVLKPPVAGVRVEGTFAREPDKTLLRKTTLYLPDPLGKRYALVHLQAFASDWSIVRDEFLAAVNSTRMQRSQPPKAAGAPAQAQGKPGPGKPGQGSAHTADAPADDAGTWKSLPVAGSLVLAALVLGHLLLSGRAGR